MPRTKQARTESSTEPKDRASGSRLALLLAAEKLFALHGLNGVSLRQVVAAARQRNTSMVHYHFGSREALVYAICDYRMSAIESERAQFIARYLEAPPEPAKRVAAVVNLLIEPSAQPIIASRGRSHARRLLAHSFVSGTFDLPSLIRERHYSSIRQVAGLLRQECPHLSSTTFAIRWALLLRSNAYLMANLEARVERMPWRDAEQLLRIEMREIAIAFAGVFVAPDSNEADAPASVTKSRQPKVQTV